LRHVRRFLLSVEGLTPEAVAWILVLGLVLGVFPVPWCPTILCTAAALSGRMNLAAIHLVNQLTTPLQLALIVPFSRMGAWILGHDAWSLRTAVIDSVTGWACIALPFSLLLFPALLHALRMSYRGRPAAEASRLPV
jgi:hypothetical protein